MDVIDILRKSPGGEELQQIRNKVSFFASRNIAIMLTLSTQSANILVHGLYAHNVMHQYIGAGDFTRVSSEPSKLLG